MAIEYTKLLRKYISEGLSENEEVFNQRNAKNLIEQEIKMLEKEQYKREMEILEVKCSLNSEELIKKFDMGDDLDFFELYVNGDSYNRVGKRQLLVN